VKKSIMTRYNRVSAKDSSWDEMHSINEEKWTHILKLLKKDKPKILDLQKEFQRNKRRAEQLNEAITWVQGFLPDLENPLTNRSTNITLQSLIEKIGKAENILRSQFKKEMVEKLIYFVSSKSKIFFIFFDQETNNTTVTVSLERQKKKNYYIF